MQAGDLRRVVGDAATYWPFRGMGRDGRFLGVGAARRRPSASDAWLPGVDDGGGSRGRSSSLLTYRQVPPCGCEAPLLWAAAAATVCLRQLRGTRGCVGALPGSQRAWRRVES